MVCRVRAAYAGHICRFWSSEVLEAREMIEFSCQFTSRMVDTYYTGPWRRYGGVGICTFETLDWCDLKIIVLIQAH